MKKSLNKIKASLVTFGMVLISLPSKIFGQDFEIGPTYEQRYDSLSMYGVPTPPPSFTKKLIIVSIITAGPILTLTTFIIGIISFIKIRNIDDETLKKKKIKRTIITISILVILIIIWALSGLPDIFKDFIYDLF